METETTTPIIGHVQADAFCDGCGYNLHTQAVTRDERLGILICRCPECGRFAPAGNLTSARTVWLNRLGLGLLITWILFLLGFFGLLTLFDGVTAYGFTQVEVEFRPVTATTTVAWPGGYQYQLRPPPQSDAEAYRRRVDQIMVTTIAILLGCIAGGAVSVCMWHVSGWRVLVGFLPPFIGVGFTLVTWINDPTAEFVQDVAFTHMGWIFSAECVGVLFGLRFGRPVARAALTILVPPRPRQHLSFLWTTDGKTLRI